MCKLSDKTETSAITDCNDWSTHSYLDLVGIW